MKSQRPLFLSASPKQIGLWYLAFTSGTLCCRVGRRKQTFDHGCGDNSPQNTSSGTIGEQNPDGWSRGSRLSLKQCTDEGRKVNKQLKCQQLNVSEVLAALPFASQQKQVSRQQLNLVSKAFFPISSVGRRSISSSEGALYRQLCHYCKHKKFHSTKICIIQNKCRFLFVLGQLWMWCFYVSSDIQLLILLCMMFQLRLRGCSLHS